MKTRNKQQTIFIRCTESEADVLPSLQPNVKEQAYIEMLAELRAIDLAVDAAQSRPDDWTAAQRDAAPVADRSQLREDYGEIIFAF